MVIHLCPGPLIEAVNATALCIAIDVVALDDPRARSPQPPASVLDPLSRLGGDDDWARLGPVQTLSRPRWPRDDPEADRGRPRPYREPMSEPHLERRDGDLGEPPPPPTEAEFAAQARDARQGDAIADQPFGDEALHAAAADAVAWDENTN